MAWPLLWCLSKQRSRIRLGWRNVAGSLVSYLNAFISSASLASARFIMRSALKQSRSSGALPRKVQVPHCSMTSYVSLPGHCQLASALQRSPLWPNCCICWPVPWRIAECTAFLFVLINLTQLNRSAPALWSESALPKTTTIKRP